MKWMFAITLTGLLFASPAIAADKEARNILEKAVKAHGGETALSKILQCKRTDTGKQVILNGKEVPFVSEVTRSLPGRVRLQIELDKKISTTIVLDGEKGWQREGRGPTFPLPAQRVKELRDEAYVWWLTTLVPLQKADFTLKSGDERKIEGEQAVGIIVSHKGFADSTLYFNKRNGLLLMIKRRGLEAGLEVEKEYVYGGYKEFSGVTLPTKELVRLNTRKWTELTISDYQFLPRIDATVFGKP